MPSVLLNFQTGKFYDYIQTIYQLQQKLHSFSLLLIFFAAARFKTDYYVAGIAPSSDGNIVLLTYSEAEVKKEV